jgi:GntR family transcriptional regulator
MINPDLPIPLHRQLSDLLRKQINSGKLTVRVPSVRTLTQQYGVSHRTAEHSLRTLAEEGLIVAVHGKGYYVTH